MYSELAFDGIGLEVAPYFDPTISKSDFKVLYTDYVDTDELRRKAALQPNPVVDAVQEIDFVWHPGSPLRQCVPPGTRFDYAVASHVMEHVPNPVGWLNDILSVLKLGDKIALFLPDRRTTFDRWRNITPFSELVHLWIEQPAAATPRQLMDFLSNSYHFSPSNEPPDTKDRCYTDEVAIEYSVFNYQNNNYLDAHCTVWEAEHFKPTFDRLVACGIMNVEVSEPMTYGHEFMVFLTKTGEPSRLPPVKSANLMESMNHQLAVIRQELGASIRRANEVQLSNDNDKFMESVNEKLAMIRDDVKGMGRGPETKFLRDKVAKLFSMRSRLARS